jgi:hypothetical protein
MELEDTDEFIKKLAKFTLAVQNEIVEESVRDAMQPILSAMIANTPESDGSRRRQSQASRTKWSGSQKLKHTIRAEVRKRMKFGVVGGALGLVGPSYSDGGGHGNLFARDHKRKVLWGRDSGTVRKVNQFVKRTADQTRSAAQSRILRSLASGIDRAAKKALS